MDLGRLRYLFGCSKTGARAWQACKVAEELWPLTSTIEWFRSFGKPDSRFTQVQTHQRLSNMTTSSDGHNTDSEYEDETSMNDYECKLDSNDYFAENSWTFVDSDDYGPSMCIVRGPIFIEASIVDIINWIDDILGLQSLTRLQQRSSFLSYLWAYVCFQTAKGSYPRFSDVRSERYTLLTSPIQWPLGADQPLLGPQVCHVRPRAQKAGKTYPTCGFTCDAALTKARSSKKENSLDPRSSGTHKQPSGAQKLEHDLHNQHSSHDLSQSPRQAFSLRKSQTAPTDRRRSQPTILLPTLTCVVSFLSPSSSSWFMTNTFFRCP